MTVKLGCCLYLVLFVLLAWMLCGCTAVKVQSEDKPDLAPLPRPSKTIRELERQAFGFASRAAGLVLEKGSPPGADLVAQLRQVIDAGRARAGLSAKAPPEPVAVDSRVVGADTLIKRLERELVIWRALEEAWKDGYEGARGEPVKSWWSLGSISWLWSLPAILIIAAVIFFPILLKLVPFVIGRLLATRIALREVVGGVDALFSKGDTHLVNESEARKILAAHRGPETKAVIRKTKKKLGLPVKPEEVE